jgi:hypothetical protein
MIAEKCHPLLKRGAQLTEKASIWTLKQHPYTVAGSCRGFEVRVYHYPAEGWDPYLITLVSAKEGWVMDSTYSVTAEAAEASAREMLDYLAHRQSRTFTPADLQRMTDYKDRVERLTDTLLAAIDAAGATPAQAKHALTRALGAIIGSSSPRSETDRAAAVSIAGRAIAGAAEDAAVQARNDREPCPNRCRLN